MKKAILLFLSLLVYFCGFPAHGQSTKGTLKSQPFRAVFYNTENLFDTIDDPATNDADFLPKSRIPWTSERYETKLDHIGKVIAALADPKPAAVIGLCEVENQAVLEDLVKAKPIGKYRYSIIHFESPDERGIDNALLYDPRQFQPVSARALHVDLTFLYGDRTRDILYVKGVPLKSKTDTLHIFINHWPSRSGGQEASEPKRVFAARVLKHVTDSLMNLPQDPIILVMGDFNDEPGDKSLSVILGALAPEINPDPKKLYNMGFPVLNAGKGSYYYRDWDVFDQVIVNGYFILKDKGLVITGEEEGIFSPEWIMFKDNDGNLRPNRTEGKDYYGGYSDHLPVYLDMMIVR